MMSKYIGFIQISDGPSTIDFFSGGTDCFVRRIFLVVCQSELSVDEKETRRLVKLSDLTWARNLLSLLVKLLSLRLSEGYLVLCQVARALHLSEISILICRGLQLALGKSKPKQLFVQTWLGGVRLYRYRLEILSYFEVTLIIKG